MTLLGLIALVAAGICGYRTPLAFAAKHSQTGRTLLILTCIFGIIAWYGIAS